MWKEKKRKAEGMCETWGQYEKGRRQGRLDWDNMRDERRLC